MKTEVGIKLSDDIVVELGEIKEKLLDDLDTHNIDYEIPFDKLNKEGIKETIIHIKDIETEISVENDIITYIKSNNNKFTHLDTIEDIQTDPLKHIKTIQNKVKEIFDNNEFNLKIEKIDTKTMNITLIITYGNKKARIQILRDSFGEVYINTLRAI